MVMKDPMRAVVYKTLQRNILKLLESCLLILCTTALPALPELFLVTKAKQL